MSAILGAVLLPETCPNVESGPTAIQRLRNVITRLIDHTSTNKEPIYSRVAQISEPATTEGLQEDESIELQNTQSSRESSKYDLEKDIEAPLGTTYTRKVILQILSVSLLAFHKVSSDVLVPIFLANPAAKPGGRVSVSVILGKLDGGFGLSPAHIGYILLTQAAITTVAQILLVPRIIAWIGVRKLYRRIILPFPLLYTLIPLTVALPKVLAILSLMVILAFWVVLVAIGYTCCSIL